MRVNLALIIFFLCLSLSSTQAQKLKSSLSYDVQSLDTNQKISNKINIELTDLNYQIPIQSKMHTIHGLIEFDAAYLIKFRNSSNDSRYLHTDEISQIISNELDKTTLEITLNQKHLEVTSNNFNRHILVKILDIERLTKNQVRCRFTADLEFPIQVKAKYQNFNNYQSKIKLKFRTKQNNFFSKSQTTELMLNLNQAQ